MKSKILILVFLALLVLILLLYLLWFSSGINNLKKTNNISFDKTDIIKIRRQIQELMNVSESEQVYEKIKSDYKTSDISIQHQTAHIYGELLYFKEGLKGIRVCDNGFSIGCYHSFIGLAMADKGLGILKELDDACLEKFGQTGGLGCIHGIGHGLGEYLGPKRLTEQLQECDKLSWKKPISGCIGGVFMEYNFPLNISGGKISSTRRNFDPKNIYSECPKVPKKYHRACYFELGQWWGEVLNANYKKMGEYCSELTDKYESIECFRGIGNTIGPTNNMNLEQTINNCQKMPNIDGELYCRSGAAWSFFADPTTREQYPKLCQGIGNKVLEETCLKYADVLELGIGK